MRFPVLEKPNLDIETSVGLHSSYAFGIEFGCLIILTSDPYINIVIPFHF